VDVAGRSSRSKSKSGWLSFFFLILFLAACAFSGYLFQTNQKLQKDIQKMRQEKIQAEKDLVKARAQLKQKEDELAELKIQAVIKNPGN